MLLADNNDPIPVVHVAGVPDVDGLVISGVPGVEVSLIDGDLVLVLQAVPGQHDGGVAGGPPEWLDLV